MYIIGDSDFKPELQWHIQSINSNSMEIKNKNLDKIIFKLKSWKKHMSPETFQILCSRIGAFLGEICVQISDVQFLKFNDIFHLFSN